MEGVDKDDDDDEGEDEQCAAPLILVLVSRAAQFTTIWQHARPQSQSSLWRWGRGLCLWPGLGLGQCPGVRVRINRRSKGGHLRLIYLVPQRHFTFRSYKMRSMRDPTDPRGLRVFITVILRWPLRCEVLWWE